MCGANDITGAVHLTPIDSVLQMRPQLSYLDALEQHAKATQARNDSEESGSELEDASAQPKKQALQVRQTARVISDQRACVEEARHFGSGNHGTPARTAQA